MSIPTPCLERRVADFLPPTTNICGLLQFILATRPLAFIVRLSEALNQQAPSYREDLRTGFILAIGAAKEAGDAFAEADKRGWLAPLLAQIPKEEQPAIHGLHADLRSYCDKTCADSLLSRITPIRNWLSFHVNRTRLDQAHQRLSSTVQEFHFINPSEGVADPFLNSLSAEIVEVSTAKTSSELQFLAEQVPHLIAALANFGEQIYNLLLLERIALEKNAPECNEKRD